LKELLKAYLDIEKIKLVPRGYDLVGHVAILEFPDKLKKEKRLIAKALMETQKNIKTVLEKASERKGKLRLRKYKLLAGIKKTETVHKEYGMQFKVDPTKVYFSPRELTERQRIAEQVKPREKVLVMFSGVCPYGIAVAKKQPKSEVICIEINKKAVKYADENVRLNRIKNMRNYCGDVRKVCPELKQKFNRIIMPLPLEAESFLDLATSCIKKNGIIHFYNWGDEKDLFGNAIKLVEKNMRKAGKKFKILNRKKVLPYAPRKWKVCLDVRVL
jgi:tRNA (guanine37-N1)-methyltransferase